MKGYKYEIFKKHLHDNLPWTWHIKSSNGKIIGWGTGYNTKQSATKGLKAICKSMGGDWGQIRANIDYL